MNIKNVQENLLYPLAELIIEKLKDTNVEELLQNYEENRKELEEKFVKRVKDLCDICQELKNKELNKVITPLKSKVDDFSDYLEKYKINDNKEKNETTLELEEEGNKLEKIVEVIKNLEKQVKTCHEALTNKEYKEKKTEINSSESKELETQSEEQHRATIEIPIDK
ncbi:1815_t:CDS:2 [Entrophospora sp. SA101]|nr:1815_t:CDS:2 [Entrophospora sp. SA101]